MQESYKDIDGRITQWFDGDVTPAPYDDPDRAAIRNSSGRIFLEDKETFEVIVKVGGIEHIVASGVAKAKTGKRCSIFVRVRAEADVPIPEPPVEEIR